MQQAKKNDAEMATALKQLELSEQLTRPTMNSFVPLVSGPLSTEQIYVLEARSATLTPPASDLPATAELDPAAQKALLDKTAGYVSKTYAQLPAITATKTTIRFQDNVEATTPASGTVGGAKEVTTESGFVNPFQFIHYINSTETKVLTEHGAEKLPAEKDKTQWGANKMIALLEPDPSLSVVFQEAKEAADLKWLRWETVHGKLAAVFSFDVPKKKSHFAMNVCCFPDVAQAGKIVRGNFQTATSWQPYKASVPYHGEFFVDAESGIVVRMITFADLKPTDVVHQEDLRIDYGPVSVDGKMIVVPIKTYTSTEVVPNGDSGLAGKYSVRRTFFTSEYKNYQSGAAK